MIPDTYTQKSVRLYRAAAFPSRWVFDGELLAGRDFVDTSIFEHDGCWWIMTQTHPGGNDTLRLYYADSLRADWTEHPMSPIIAGDPHVARPAGRVLSRGDGLIRFAQDDFPTYGRRVWAFEVRVLTKTHYEEARAGAVLEPGPAWTALGMHTLDAHQVGDSSWIAAVDGLRRTWVFRWGS